MCAGPPVVPVGHPPSPGEPPPIPNQPPLAVSIPPPILVGPLVQVEPPESQQVDMHVCPPNVPAGSPPPPPVEPPPIPDPPPPSPVQPPPSPLGPVDRTGTVVALYSDAPSILSFVKKISLAHSDELTCTPAMKKQVVIIP